MQKEFKARNSSMQSEFNHCFEWQHIRDTSKVVAETFFQLATVIEGIHLTFKRHNIQACIEKMSGLWKKLVRVYEDLREYVTSLIIFEALFQVCSCLFPKR